MYKFVMLRHKASVMTTVFRFFTLFRMTTKGDYSKKLLLRCGAVRCGAVRCGAVRCGNKAYT